MIKISFVVAMSENRVIGCEGKLPWCLPNDLRHFKKLTLGKNILMGRKTFDSIGHPLKERRNFVLTREQQFFQPNVEVFHSKEAVMKSGLLELVVIGGEEIYRLFLAECQKIYLTLVHENIAGDAHFPVFHDFKEVTRTFHHSDERHRFSYSFIEYDR